MYKNMFNKQNKLSKEEEELEEYYEEFLGSY
jgi:hypothetical protein